MAKVNFNDPNLICVALCKNANGRWQARLHYLDKEFPSYLVPVWNNPSEAITWLEEKGKES